MDNKTLPKSYRKSFEEAFSLADVSKRIHIISKGNKWAVRRSKSKRALRLFKYRELAFKYACDIGGKIIVHTKDASVLFEYDC